MHVRQEGNRMDGSHTAKVIARDKLETNRRVHGSPGTRTPNPSRGVRESEKIKTAVSVLLKGSPGKVLRTLARDELFVHRFCCFPPTHDSSHSTCSLKATRLQDVALDYGVMRMKRGEYVAAQAGMQGWRKWEVPEKNHLPPASSDTIATFENPGARPRRKSNPVRLGERQVLLSLCHGVHLCGACATPIPNVIHKHRAGAKIRSTAEIQYQGASVADVRGRGSLEHLCRVAGTSRGKRAHTFVMI
ncbi:hypothetical protein PR048_019142 [Dryococelus australis]|uniref:Uncharacterized protein n=1 Tax=Dryococelus australis TaxID=614101 RepID=A0ABQ9H2N6_9NEOP|nr:hypothetical protein PR048_019142 [Dryococelus australis]